MKPSTIYGEASRLLKHPKISARIQEFQREAFVSARVEVKDVVRQLCAIAFADVATFLEVDKEGQTRFDAQALLQSRAGAAVQEVVVRPDGSVKLKFASRTQALGLLAKHLGMLDQTKMRPFNEWSEQQIKEVFGVDAQTLIEAQEAEAQQELLPAPTEAG